MQVFSKISQWIVCLLITLSVGCGSLSDTTSSSPSSNNNKDGSSWVDNADSSDSSTSGSSTGETSTGSDSGTTTGGSTGGATGTGGSTTGGSTGGSTTGGTTANTTYRYEVQNGKIFKDGALIHLFGVNWFGFETSNQIVHGLWSHSYSDYITQIKSLGFNAIRLPFCPNTLKGVATSSIDTSKNPDLAGLNSLQAFDKIINALNDAHLYILLDHHQLECNGISELWYSSTYSESQWITDLTTIASRYSNLEYFMGIDLKNEPHGAARWGTGNSLVDWNGAAERASSSILKANPEILVFVEGVGGDQTTCNDSSNAHWWGGNIEPINCTPLNIDSKKLVLAPHVYGPDVYNQSYFNVGNFPLNMPAIWDTQLGFATTQYPVVPGEFGGKYGDGDPKDKTWQDSFVDYLISKKMCDFFYWSWNPNSGDTGGILKDDWTNVNQGKVDNLTRLMDSCP